MSLAIVEVGMHSAVKAAREAFEQLGLEPTAVVVNVTWGDGDKVGAAGSRVETPAPELLAESLRHSAEEASGA